MESVAENHPEENQLEEKPDVEVDAGVEEVGDEPQPESVETEKEIDQDPDQDKEVAEEELDVEIEAMKRRFAEMEEEVVKIEALQNSVEKSMKPAGVMSTPAQDERSIYVGNVDYSTTNEELQAFFVSCGVVVRVTILNDKWTGPKGYAYVEFKEPESVLNAMILNETPFKGRQLKISPKRTNVPSYILRGGRGGAGGPRGAARRPPTEGYYPPRRPFRPPPYAGGYAPRRPFRPRRGGYHPYY